MHERVGEWIAFAQGVVQEKICCIDLAGFVSLASRRCLDALLEETLEVSLCWAQTVDGPASQKARVVLCDLLGGKLVDGRHIDKGLRLWRAYLARHDCLANRGRRYEM